MSYDKFLGDFLIKNTDDIAIELQEVFENYYENDLNISNFESINSSESENSNISEQSDISCSDDTTEEDENRNS
jgi:hypothetical protein